MYSLTSTMGNVLAAEGAERDLNSDNAFADDGGGGGSNGGVGIKKGSFSPVSFSWGKKSTSITPRIMGA